MMKAFLLLMIVFLGTSLLNAWEEDPRYAEYNKKTDYLLRLGNKQAEDEDEEMVTLMAYAYRERNKSIMERPTDYDEEQEQDEQ